MAMCKVIEMDLGETRLLDDSGMIILRQNNRAVTLGISRVAHPDEQPEVEILLTRRQISGLVEELSRMEKCG
jgi:hypothetical protein